MGIRASYWVTGGIMTVLGVALANVILGFLGAAAVTVGGVLMGVLAFFFKAALVLLAVWVVARLVRGRRRRREATG